MSAEAPGVCVLAVGGVHPPPQPDWLHPSERLRLHTFSSAARRRVFLAARWQARELLGRRLGLDARAIGLALDERRRSHSVHPKGWALSLSHSQDWLAVAIAPAGQGLGIDLEVERVGRDWAALAAHFELPAGGCARDFYRHWTLGEAWLKASAAELGLLAVQRLRWRRAAQGPAWCFQAGDLHLAVVADAAPQFCTADAAPRWRADGRWSCAA